MLIDVTVCYKSDPAPLRRRWQRRQADANEMLAIEAAGALKFWAAGALRLNNELAQPGPDDVRADLRAMHANSYNQPDLKVEVDLRRLELDWKQVYYNRRDGLLQSLLWKLLGLIQLPDKQVQTVEVNLGFDANICGCRVFNDGFVLDSWNSQVQEGKALPRPV